jgi:hypothetical protein
MDTGKELEVFRGEDFDRINKMNRMRGRTT